MLDATVSGQLGGRVVLGWESSGLVCEMEVPLARARFEEALGSTEPLTTLERRARGGIVARQVTLR